MIGQSAGDTRLNHSLTQFELAVADDDRIRETVETTIATAAATFATSAATIAQTAATAFVESRAIALGKGVHALQDCFAHSDEFVTQVSVFGTENLTFWTHANRRGWNADTKTVCVWNDKDETAAAYAPTMRSPCGRDFGCDVNGRVALTRLSTWLYLAMWARRFREADEAAVDLVRLATEDVEDWEADGTGGLGCLNGFADAFAGRWSGDEVLARLFRRIRAVAEPEPTARPLEVRGNVVQQGLEAVEYALAHLECSHGNNTVAYDSEPIATIDGNVGDGF